MQKDGEHFKGSEELLNLVRANVTEASLVNETKDQVVKKKMVNATMVNVPLISSDAICHKIQIPVFYLFMPRLKFCFPPLLPKSSPTCWRPLSLHRCR